MRIRLDNFTGNILSLMRSGGYMFLDRTQDDEWNFVRRVGAGDYPRFHCYVKKEEGNLMINLHLDQKRPSYQGSRGHSGEYEGEIITFEAERLRQSFLKTR